MTPSAMCINLRRRPDRWSSFLDSWAGSMLEIERVEGVDGLDAQSLADFKKEVTSLRGEAVTIASQVGLGGLVSQGGVGCWLSHQRVFRLICQTSPRKTTSDAIQLVLEDDSIPALNLRAPLNTELNLAVSLMRHHRLDILQVGFVEGAYPRFGTRNILDWILAIRARRLVLFQRRLFFLDEFRAGTHAYLISARGAAILQGFNVPVFLPADAAIEALARNTHTLSGKFRVARLARSIVNQRDRSDSDID